MAEYRQVVKARIKSTIHYAFGDYIKNIQLSTEDYREELERIAEGILEDTTTVEMYEALKEAQKIVQWVLEKQTGYISDIGLEVGKVNEQSKQALAKAEGKP